MARLSPVLRSAASTEGRFLVFWCPGCDSSHTVRVRPHGDASARPGWTFNENVDKPTFTPSILVTSGRRVDPAYVPDPDFPDPPEVCHSYVTDGRIQFLADSTHALAGQTVDLPAWHQDYGGTEE